MAHGRQQIRPCLQRQSHEDVSVRKMMLERLPFLRRQPGFFRTVKEAKEIPLPVALHAVAQDEILHAATDIDGVNLDVTVVAQRGCHVGNPGTE